MIFWQMANPKSYTNRKGLSTSTYKSMNAISSASANANANGVCSLFLQPVCVCFSSQLPELTAKWLTGQRMNYENNHSWWISMFRATKTISHWPMSIFIVSELTSHWWISVLEVTKMSLLVNECLESDIESQRETETQKQRSERFPVLLQKLVALLT